MKKGIDIYDIEQYPNFHSYTGIDKDSEKITVFSISELSNDIEKYIEYLEGLEGMIGYNNISYDYPMIHFILLNKNRLLELDYIDINKLLYEESQRIINDEWSSIAEWEVLIPQLDLFLIKHYNNKARSTNLKWLEFTLRWHKLQDLPFKFHENIKKENIQLLLDYNLNDVLATKHFMNEECLNDIIFRKNMTVKLGKNVMNYSDVKIGEYINRITYERLSGRNYKEFKDKRTYRKIFHVKDLIPDFIKFKTKQLQDFLEDIKYISFKDDEDFLRVLQINELTVSFMKGGIHSKDIPRIIECKEGYKLKEKDVGSMYPASIINQSLYPQHLGISWTKGIEQSYNYRLNELKPLLKTYKKGTDEYNAINSEQEAYKLSMNGGGYGKTGSSYSWQYDPMVIMRTTFMGQLSLIMLLEELSLVNGIELLSANTDGIVIHYPKSLEDKVTKIHKEWEINTKFNLEDTSYSKLVYSTVNDYMAVIIDEKTKEFQYIKFKGDFEIDPEPHKNNSQRIVPICLKEYFINGIEPRDIISKIGYEFVNSKGKKENTTIYDYCIGRKKADGQIYHYVEKNKTTEIQDKVIRYYIVDPNKCQNKLYKEYTKGKKGAKAKETGERALEAISKGFNHMLFMNYEEKDDYMIDELYYVQECMKIIDPIERNTRLLNAPKVEQLNLF